MFKVPFGSRILDRGFLANPYPYYHWLRKFQPIFYLRHWDLWLISRYADCVALLQDHRLGHTKLPRKNRFKSTAGPELSPAHQIVCGMQNKWILFLNPPEHSHLRRLVQRAFNFQDVQKFKQEAQIVVNLLLDRVENSGRMELMNDLAYPLPTIMTAKLLGIPAEEQEIFRRWSRDITPTLNLTDYDEVYKRAMEATIEATDYFKTFLNGRRELATGLIRTLVEFKNSNNQVSEDELYATCILLLGAGYETTANLIGNGLLALLNHPHQLEQLRANPTLVLSAVDELLRYDGPVQLTSRVALEDITFKSFKIKKGQEVVLLLGSANRDPEKFKNPDTLDLERTPNLHLAFSSGIHRCLGEPLAHLQVEIAINTLLKRLPNLALTSQNREYRGSSTLHGLKELHLTF